jgi:hypothetical protein
MQAYFLSQDPLKCRAKAHCLDMHQGICDDLHGTRCHHFLGGKSCQLKRRCDHFNHTCATCPYHSGDETGQVDTDHGLGDIHFPHLCLAACSTKDSGCGRTTTNPDHCWQHVS